MVVSSFVPECCCGVSLALSCPYPCCPRLSHPPPSTHHQSQTFHLHVIEVDLPQQHTCCLLLTHYLLLTELEKFWASGWHGCNQGLETQCIKGYLWLDPHVKTALSGTKNVQYTRANLWKWSFMQISPVNYKDTTQHCACIFNRSHRWCLMHCECNNAWIILIVSYPWSYLGHP